jgi:hypothetical protein
MRNVFMQTEATAASFWIHMGIAFVAAIIMTELGTRWGEWMRQIRR